MTARITPYEQILQQLEARAFPAIRDEAEQRGTETIRRDQFILLGNVGATLREIVTDDAEPDALEEYADLLYHGYQFWTFGRRMYELEERVSEHLTQPRLDLEGWIFAGPPSCYFQFPYQRLWARVSLEAPFEPVDGCFVVTDDTAPAPGAGAHLRTQLVLGLRPERPGISLVSYCTDLDPNSAADKASRPWRDDAAPFENAIPGGDRKGYKALVTTSELEALVIRALFFLDRNALTLRPREGSLKSGETRLPYTTVTMP